MSMSQLPDEYDLADQEKWYNRALFILCAGLVFVCVPFIMAWLWIREKMG